MALHDSSTGAPRTLVTSRPRWNQCVSRHVALGDRDEAGQPRFGGEQVVVRRIEAARALGVGEPIADREQLPLRVEEEAEVHAVEEGDARSPALERGSVAASAARPSRSADGERQQRAGEVAAVDGGDVGRRQRRQRARVVPVQQVTLEALQPLDGRERRVDSLDQLVGVDEPRSCAASVASRPMPMLVGEVRCATLSSGTTWTLSGGSQWSSWPTKSRK